MKTSETEIRRVSSQKCCKLRCCQSFPWEDTRTLRRKFFASTFEARREMAYGVQTQLHAGVIPGMKFVTLANIDVCENAWYIIHGVSRSAYHVYKAAAAGGSVSGSHGNAGARRPRPQTIQAQATLMTIINENADQMPNEFRLVGNKRVDNLKVVPSAMNWDHMREQVNYVSSSCSSASAIHCTFCRLPADMINSSLGVPQPGASVFSQCCD
jgi:hypothetical protein